MDEKVSNGTLLAVDKNGNVVVAKSYLDGSILGVVSSIENGKVVVDLCSGGQRNLDYVSFRTSYHKCVVDTSKMKFFGTNHICITKSFTIYGRKQRVEFQSNERSFLLGLLKMDGSEVDSKSYSRVKITVSEDGSIGDVYFPIATEDWGTISRIAVYSCIDKNKMLTKFAPNNTSQLKIDIGVQARLHGLKIMIPGFVDTMNEANKEGLKVAIEDREAFKSKLENARMRLKGILE